MTGIYGEGVNVPAGSIAATNTQAAIDELNAEKAALAGLSTQTFSAAGFRTSEAANGKQGVATLVAGAVVVSNTSIAAASRIFLTSQSDGGTVGFVRVSARVVGTSFTITSSSGTDTSVVAYEIFEAA